MVVGLSKTRFSFIEINPLCYGHKYDTTAAYEFAVTARIARQDCMAEPWNAAA